MEPPNAVPPLALRFSCIAFDFDGTLADTSSAIVAAAARTLRDLKCAPLREELFHSLIGIPLRDAFAEAGVPPARLDAAVDRYREVFPEFQGSIRLFPGVRSCLERLRKHDVRLGIVSSRSRPSLAKLVKDLEIGAYFQAILGEEDAPKSKPAPDLMLALAAALGVSPTSALVIGDTTFDIEMGNAAGSRTVAVTYGNHSREQLQRAAPDHFADALEDIWSIQ